MSKNVLFTVGVGLITAALGFVVGSKWTERHLKRGLEDLYQQEYDLLREKLEEDYQNAKKTEENKPSEEEFKADDKENYVNNEPDIDENGYFDSFDDEIDEDDVDSDDPTRKRPHKTAKQKERYEEIMKENEYYKNGNPEYPYIISYDEYYDNKDYIERHLTWDSDNNMLIDDDDPHHVIDDIDELISYEAIDLIEDGGESIVYIRNDQLKTDFVLERYCPRN